MRKEIKANGYYYLWLLVVSFIAMLFMTTASPMFQANNSWDTNDMFTIGRGMLHGMMPYRYLFDQRGPVIYILHTFAAIISNHSGLGLYIFEALALFIDLLFVQKIINFVVKNKLISYASTFLFIPFTFNNTIFINGDLVEEFMLPMALVTIYKIIQHPGFHFSHWDAYWQGIFVALIFWSKYTILGLWIGCFLYIGIYLLIKKEFKRALIMVRDAFLGFITITIPLFIYFIAFRSFRAMLHVYFYLNLNYYHKTASLFTQVKSYLMRISSYNHDWDKYVIILLIGVIFMFFIREFNWNAKGALALGFISDVVITTYVSNNYVYYYFAMASYMVFFTLLLAVLIKQLTKIKGLSLAIVSTFVFVIAMMLIPVNNNEFIYSRLFPNNPYVDASGKTNESFQNQFARIILHDSTTDNPTILNFGSMDTGIFTSTQTLPNTKFYIQNNMHAYKPMRIGQLSQLEDEKDQFVVITYMKSLKRHHSHFTNSNITPFAQRFLSTHYTKVAEHTNILDGRLLYKHILYELKQPNS
ncbi:hypothetical protein [Philodulcilactobacillus myokoensis]|nr:hypothetical protein [Philodulcilactobacillus myokoensis]